MSKSDKEKDKLEQEFEDIFEDTKVDLSESVLSTDIDFQLMELAELAEKQESLDIWKRQYFRKKIAKQYKAYFESDIEQDEYALQEKVMKYKIETLQETFPEQLIQFSKDVKEKVFPRRKTETQTDIQDEIAQPEELFEEVDELFEEIGDVESGMVEEVERYDFEEDKGDDMFEEADYDDEILEESD